MGRIVGGGAAPAQKMAEELQSVIHLNTSVRLISQDNSSATLHLHNGESISARAVVVTGAPSVVGRIAFEPPLTTLKKQLVSEVPMGNAVRMNAVFSRPFWRENGLSGSHGDETKGALLPIGYDMTPCDQSNASSCATAPGVLQVETTGRATEILMSMGQEERMRNFTNYMAQYYGPEALQPDDFLSFDFSRVPSLGGGSQAHFPPGVWTKVGKALRGPHGLVHFAGTEYAAVGFGYVNGAIESGNKTA